MRLIKGLKKHLILENKACRYLGTDNAILGILLKTPKIPAVHLTKLFLYIQVTYTYKVKTLQTVVRVYRSAQKKREERNLFVTQTSEFLTFQCTGCLS